MFSGVLGITVNVEHNNGFFYALKVVSRLILPSRMHELPVSNLTCSVMAPVSISRINVSLTWMSGFVYLMVLASWVTTNETP